MAASSGSITLVEVANRTAVLAIACTRCDRARTYPLEMLVARHGGRIGIPTLLRMLTADCPNRSAFTEYDICGVHCPELPVLFRR
jgi:hypothetical protein